MNDDLISRSKLIEDIEKIHMYIKGLRSGKSVLADMLEKYADAEIVGGIAVFDKANKQDKKIDITDYVDTGYMEFYIYCDTDGIEVPFSVEASGHDPRTFATFKVKYDKAKARKDGYMQVRIPFTYFADSGLNLDEICRVTIKGTQSSLYCDYFLLSSFRFYTNLADIPDPEPIVEPEPEPERDLPLEIDSSILNAKLDKEKMISGHTAFR